MTKWYEKDQMNLEYHVTVSLWNDTKKDNDHHWVGFDIKLKRKFTCNFIEFILLPASLVLVSWVSKKLNFFKK